MNIIRLPAMSKPTIFPKKLRQRLRMNTHNNSVFFFLSLCFREGNGGGQEQGKNWSN